MPNTKATKTEKIYKDIFSHLLFLENLVGYICSRDKDVSIRGRKFPRKLQVTIDCALAETIAFFSEIS